MRRKARPGRWPVSGTEVRAMGKEAHRGDDPYDVLGVRAGASREDIVRAYRRAAHGSHPDARPADPQAAGRFQALTEAYDLLSDPSRRAEYDRSRAPEPKAPRAAPSHPAKPSVGTWPRPLLWAGPVHIQSATQQPGDQLWHRPADPAGAYMLEWYLNRIWGWP
jgi:curved DNA-binding protein CbpA